MLRPIQFAIMAFALTHSALSQLPPTPPGDPPQQRVSSIALNDQSVIDGIAMLSRRAGLAVSVEFELGTSISRPAPSLKTTTTTVGPGAVSEVLDRLCSLDPTFTWRRNGNMINVLPSALANDPRYLLNRKIDDLTFQEVREADDAVMKMVGQLPGPREQLAVLQVGVSLNFAAPWSITLRGPTIREALNQIASRLGPSYGWQLGGAQDFRIITFHEGLLPRPSRGSRTRRANAE